jgi:hypothetical protein
MKFLKMAMIEFVMIYGLFALATAELNSAKWSQDTREWAVIIIGALWLATFAAAYIENEVEEKKNKTINETDESERL